MINKLQVRYKLGMWQFTLVGVCFLNIVNQIKEQRQLEKENRIAFLGMNVNTYLKTNSLWVLFCFLALIIFFTDLLMLHM